MAWRTILISSPARLRIEHSCLVVAQDEEASIPLEDIAALILESPAISLSSAALYRLAQQDVAVIVCDEKHLPCAMTLPCVGNCRLVKAQRLQLDLNAPFRKRLWQGIIKQKITNQAECLRLRGETRCAELFSMAEAVTSGDAGNVESLAAKTYFGLLFGKGFFRGGPDAVNSALDYGYAVLRAAVTRALAGRGFLLSQGLHHHSELNPFNLADDFLEPFRPVVDLRVVGMMARDELLEREHRVALVELLGCDVLMEGRRQAVLRAADLTASSFLSCCREKDTKLLKLPELLELNPHKYE